MGLPGHLLIWGAGCPLLSLEIQIKRKSGRLVVCEEHVTSWKCGLSDPPHEGYTWGMMWKTWDPLG